MSGVRFAPSPTGRFHIGNLRTAWIAREWARALRLPWVLRFEDIDRPRVLAGARESQLRDMAALGLVGDWVSLQSDHFARHAQAFGRAVDEGAVYACHCSRAEVKRALEGLASAPHAELPLYSGHCRSSPSIRLAQPAPGPVAWRFRQADPTGQQDFIVARAKEDFSEFTPAYNWACAIDDFDGGFDLLVRAWDLAPVVDQQRAIHELLGRWHGPRAAPAVYHAALVTQNDGHRLEKRTPGVTLDELFKSGWPGERLLALFESGFALERAEYVPEKVWGEARRRLSVKELGFSSTWA